MKEGVITLNAAQYERKHDPRGIDECYQDLAVAIVRQACYDYEKTLIELYKGPSGKKKAALLMDKKEQEMFFHSQWYEFLMNADPIVLMEGIRQRAQKKVREQVEKRAGVKKLKSVNKAGTPSVEDTGEREEKES